MQDAGRGRAWLPLVAAVALGVPGPARAGAAGAPPDEGGRPRRLTATSSLEAELAGGEVHRYEIDLTAGDYLVLVFDQRGIDIHPVVLGPDGARIFRNDTGEWGREEVAMVAPSSGLYLIDAEPARGTLPRGGYALRVEALRPATTEDQAHAHLMDLLSRAYGALSVRNVATGGVANGDIPQARALYQEALAAARTQRDRPDEAFALTALGFIANHMDDFRADLEYTRQALPIWHEVGNQHAEARAWGNLGLSLGVLGEEAEQISAYEKGLAIQRATGNLHAQCNLLNSLAYNLGARGEFDAALADAYEALALARRLGDAPLEAQIAGTVALIYLDLGEYEACVDGCRRILDGSSLDDVERARFLGVMGAALVRLGDRPAARKALEEALAYWTKANWRGLQARVLIDLGDLYLRDGDLEQARNVFETAAARAAAIGYVYTEASCRRWLAETLVRLGRLEEAEAAMRAAADLSQGDPDPNSRAFDLVLEARLALARGDASGARRHAEAALSLSESARARATIDRFRRSRLASSQVVYETLVDVLMTQHARRPRAGFEARALEVSERARARSLLELMLGGASGGAGGPEGALLDQTRDLQRRLGAKARALDVAQRAKNDALVASMRHEIDELSDQFALLDTRMRRGRSTGSIAATPEPLTLSAIRAQVLDEQTTLVEYLLSESASYAFVVSRDAIASQRLAPRKTIEDAAAALQKAIAAPPAASPGRRAALDAAAASLGDLLLGPVRGIAPGRRLLIVAPGTLQQIPFAALTVPGGTQRLIDRNEIVQAPSASVVAASRKAHASRPPAARVVAIFADPVYDAADPRVVRAMAAPPQGKDGADQPVTLLGGAVRSLQGGDDRTGLSRLPFTRQEAEAIAALAPPGSVRMATGFDAMLAAVTDPSLADYRIVHFATHGLLDARSPELSGLIFSLVDETGAPVEGYLRLRDIGRLHLNADLAVLSGCETGLGRTVGGEGVIGLTRGFTLAGARSVMASLWKIDDLATADLMERFYRGLLVQHLPAPAALRQAQREMEASETWSDPYHWAGFVIQGEWR
ncbi:MAG TPA: CHAT domain-containing tetratricopeptide repeat protein [Candidatus Cryosericum sp.]|nr:CHAT domain-containing tetratricopeptide repeat protein [Candidatus Cryosericum sp.]